MGLSYDISFSIAGAILVVALIFTVSLHYSSTNILNKRFRLFLYWTLALIVLDVGTVVSNDYASYLPLWLNIVLNSIYFLVGTITAIFFLYYCISLALKELEPQARKKIYIANLAILGAYVITLILNGFFGFFFYFNEAMVYSRGPAYVLVNILSLVFTLEGFLLFGLRWKQFNLRQKISMVAFFTIFYSSFVLQIVALPNVLLTDFGTALGCLLIFFSLETPDYVKLIATLEELNELKASLEIQVASRTEELVNEKHSYEELTLETLSSLALVIDAKDHYTVGHSFRVASYSKGIGEVLGFSAARLENLYFAGLIHDVGKIGIKEEILTKPGKLSPQEFEAIKAHSAIGGDILKGIKEFPVFEAVARSHHERFDGTGYPDKIGGDDILLEARIVAVADAYDAMTSDRSYRKALPEEVAIQEIKDGMGTQFDPNVARAFLVLAGRYGDSLRNHYKELASDIASKGKSSNAK